MPAPKKPAARKPTPVWRSVVFQSPDDVMRVVADARRANAAAKWDGDGTSLDAEWYGCKDYKEMESVVANGWPKGAARIREMLTAVNPLVEQIRARAQSVAFDLAGSWLDIGRHLQGEPECWGSVVQSHAEGVSDRIVRLDCSLSASGGMSAEDFFARGAAACAFADVVEAAGYRCEIWTASGEQQFSGPLFQHRILLKRADEPLELERVAAVLAHPGFFRRAIFNLFNVHGFRPNASMPAAYVYEEASLPPEQRHFADLTGVVRIQHLHLWEVQAGGGLEKFLRSKLAEAGIAIENLFDGANR